MPGGARTDRGRRLGGRGLPAATRRRGARGRAAPRGRLVWQAREHRQPGHVDRQTDVAHRPIVEADVLDHAPAPAASGVTKAWHDSLHGFAVGVDGIIRLAGPLLFALLCVAALVIGGRLTWRRVQRHNL